LISNLSTDKIVVLSTHILEEVTAVCNRALVIAHGRLLADDSPAALQARSRYHQAVTLEFANNFDLQAEAVHTKIENLASVGSVEQARDHAGRVTVLANNELSDPSVLNQELTQLIGQLGWPLQSQFIESGRLEDVFREITGGDRA